MNLQRIRMSILLVFSIESIEKTEDYRNSSQTVQIQVSAKKHWRKNMGMIIDFTGKTVLVTGGGKLDVVVHAAGVQSIDDLLLTSDEEIHFPFLMNK